MTIKSKNFRTLIIIKKISFSPNVVTLSTLYGLRIPHIAPFYATPRQRPQLKGSRVGSTTARASELEKKSVGEIDETVQPFFLASGWRDPN